MRRIIHGITLAVNVHNNKILINLDMVVKQYFINVNFEYVLGCVYDLTARHPDHDIEITATVQTPLLLAPFAGTIDAIVDAAGLPKDRITVIVRNRDFQHDRVTVKILEEPEYHWIKRQTIAEAAAIEWQLDDDAKLFGGLFGRPSLTRLQLAYHLETHHRNDSFVTLLASVKHIEDCCLGMEEYFEPQLSWARSRRNPEGAANPDCDRGSFCFPYVIREWPDVWGKYQIEVVAETDYHNRFDLTEKTWKCLGSGKPFILMSGAGSLQTLVDHGCETFAPYIDESYDREPNAWRRLDMVRREIDRIAALDQDQRRELLMNVRQIALRNQEKLQRQNV